MKQYLIYLCWYEYKKLAIIKAKNKIKAVVKLIKEQIKYNKSINEYNLFDGLPYAYYDDDLTERQNIAKYLNNIRNCEISLQCYEIDQKTDAIIQWQPQTNYTMVQIGEYCNNGNS